MDPWLQLLFLQFVQQRAPHASLVSAQVAQRQKQGDACHAQDVLVAAQDSLLLLLCLREEQWRSPNHDTTLQHKMNKAIRQLHAQKASCCVQRVMPAGRAG
jgi:hypothetical protein